MNHCGIPKINITKMVVIVQLLSGLQASFKTCYKVTLNSFFFLIHISWED